MHAKRSQDEERHDLERSLMIDADQWELYNEMCYHQTADKEAKVRELARHAVQEPSTYRLTGTAYPYLRSPRFIFESSPDLPVPYEIIRVALNPWLRGRPEAYLIAEQIIREAMDD